jgi:hypothetical protein
VHLHRHPFLVVELAGLVEDRVADAKLRKTPLSPIRQFHSRIDVRAALGFFFGRSIRTTKYGARLLNQSTAHVAYFCAVFHFGAPTATVLIAPRVGEAD